MESRDTKDTVEKILNLNPELEVVEKVVFAFKENLSQLKKTFALLQENFRTDLSSLVITGKHESDLELKPSIAKALQGMEAKIKEVEAALEPLEKRLEELRAERKDPKKKQ